MEYDGDRAQPQFMNTGNRYIKAAGYFISMIFLYLTFMEVNFSAVLNFLYVVNIYYLMGALVFNICFFVTRGFYQLNNLRFLKSDIPFFISFASIGIAQFYNVIFPARLGEIVRAFFLSKKENLNKTSILSYIFIEKIMDVLVIISLLILIIALGSENMELKNALAFF